MIASRITAGFLVFAAVAWIASGYLYKSETASQKNTATTSKTETKFSVGVTTVSLNSHARSILISGRTEADRRVMATTRAAGTIVALNIRRGSSVKEGDIIAELSDEARDAVVAEANARLTQRKSELEARLRLIRQGNYPALNKSQLEADLKSAQAQLASAEAGQDRGKVRAPVSGIVNDTSVDIGQSVQIGQSVAEIIAPDPMLAIIEIAERQLGGVAIGDATSVRLITGETVAGNIRFISSKASPQTRTYRIEVKIPNKDNGIPDGITCEVTLKLAPVLSAQITRSALTFSSEGKLGVRTVDAENTVRFNPVTLLEDGGEKVWVSGLNNGLKLIIQGQDFVKEGVIVTPVVMNEATNRP